MITMKNIKIGVSGLDGTIYIYRHGKDTALALDKRPAEQDLMAAFIQHMLYGDYSDGAETTVTFGDKQYRLTCKPVAEPPAGTEG